MLDFEVPYQTPRAIVPPVAPSIESSRLILRPATDADMPALFAVRCRPEVAVTNFPKEPFLSLEQTRKWWAAKVFTKPAAYIGRSFGFVIVDKAIPVTEEQVIGYVCIHVVEPSPEIGYSLLPESWGKGFATEALRMLLKMWWDLPRRSSGDDDRVEKIYASFYKTNPASQAVLAKCGFENVDEIHSEEMYLYVLAKPTSQDAGEELYHYI
ncbi:N-acetyltransferase GNAT family [Penicillium taxi]|uniref:N-acetyltransferase GNAT family n=1 Tax=Penicillium taxi TaxID=168475 RepID=UPI0025455494|nr:N-acetyltransferase GNAT family [Penicillium taxi]KAJ5902820.1 N-acetyltransferase GNAT family [Penicillium taxi]